MSEDANIINKVLQSNSGEYPADLVSFLDFYDVWVPIHFIRMNHSHPNELKLNLFCLLWAWGINPL